MRHHFHQRNPIMAKTGTYISPKEELAEAPQVEELLRNLGFHKTLQNITRRINAATSLREILADITEDIRKLFNFHSLTVYLADKDLEELYTLKNDGNEIRFPIDYSTFAGWVAKEKKMLHVADAYDDREIRNIHESLTFDGSLDKRTGTRTGQIVALPIIHEDLLLGVMEVMNKKDGNKIDDYHHIFLDEIISVLANTFFLHLNFDETRHIHRARFESLIQKGIMTSRQLDHAVMKSGASFKNIPSILMKHYQISKSDIGAALSNYYACPFADYNDAMPFDEKLISGIDKSILMNMLWVPLKQIKDEIHVAVDDPSDIHKKRKIENILKGHALHYVVSLPEDILLFIEHFYKTEDPSSKKTHKRSRQDGFSDEYSDFMEMKNPFDELNTKRHAEDAVQTDLSGMNAPADMQSRGLPTHESGTNFTAGLAPRPLATIVHDAYNRRATDIHFEPDSDAGNVPVRLRIEGRFLSRPALAHSDYDLLIRQIKTLARLDIDKHSIIQEGTLALQIPSGKDLSIRVTCIPTRTGMEDIVIHIAAQLKLMALEQLGLSDHHYATLSNILHQPRGLILIVGQPHSGITTTLHACLNHINTQDLKIWTAEEPIEIAQNGLRQVRINPNQGFGFPAVLHSFLKADPDVLMAGRINDEQTASVCMQAAIQGRLVLSSLWAEDIPETLERCMNMDSGPLVFADAMLAVVEQRLIKVLCPKCKDQYHPAREEYEELAQMYGKESFRKLNIPYTGAFSLFRSRGCSRCGQTGYQGKMCVSEIFIFTPRIKRMIRQKLSPQMIYQEALASGTTTLMQEGILKVLSGLSDARHVRLTCLK